MAKIKERELVHWFRVAMASDPAEPMSAKEAAQSLHEAGAANVIFVRTGIRTVASE